MRKFRWIAGFGAIGLLMASCSGNTAKTQAPTTTTQQPVASQPKPAPAPNEPVKLLPVPPELLPPVNVPQRVSQTVTKQSDPFSQLPVNSTEQPLLPAPAKTTPKTANQKATTQKPANQSSAQKAPQVESTQAQSSTKAPSNTASAKAPTKPVPVPTDLANAVVVSGIVQVQGRVSAIVIAPNEPTSRTVGVGDYLSGGQVRVKQIVLQSEPVVILEQNGVEVIKSVSSSFS
jgi:hypothetical protein